MIFVQFMAGFVLLYLGGEVLIRGAVAVAKRLGVSTFLIGITVIGFGTSVPELVTCIEAALSEAPGIALGNAVGSNIINILLILGVAAVLSPIICDPKAFQRDGTAVVIAALICAGIVLTGSLERWAGVILTALMLVYVVYSYISDKRNADAGAALHAEEAESIESLPGGLSVALIAIGVGIAGTIFGARFLVSAAIEVASAAGVPESIIGLSVVALGTSLPELATAIIAGLRGHGELAFGNVLGSNIYNVLAILGITALVHPLTVPPDIAAVDIWVMLGATGLMVAMSMTGWRVGRREGALLLCLYGVYVGDLAYRSL